MIEYIEIKESNNCEHTVYCNFIDKFERSDGELKTVVNNNYKMKICLNNVNNYIHFIFHKMMMIMKNYIGI